MAAAHAPRVIVLHRGEPPRIEPDPWADAAGSRLTQLARAIATSPGWPASEAAMLVVREEPEPLVAVIGTFSDADVAWIELARHQASNGLPSFVWHDHAATEAACAELAQRLLDRFGATELATFRYAAAPRGGLFVLGQLAYLLGLAPDRLLPPDLGRDAGPAGHPPLVVVDDVAISGLRLSEYVTARPDEALVIATLHAHPALRTAFLDRHPRVTAFVSARDLQDLAPALHGERYAAWRERWWSRAAPGVVWIGEPERVAYPWNEPDCSVWHPSRGRREPGWHLVPPERCLKHRGRRGLPVVQAPPAAGALRPADDVVFGDLAGEIVIGQLGTGACFSLAGVAASVWRLLLHTGDLEATCRGIAHAYGGVDAEQVEQDVRAMVAELRAAGLLAGVSA